MRLVIDYNYKPPSHLFGENTDGYCNRCGEQQIAHPLPDDPTRTGFDVMFDWMNRVVGKGDNE